MRFSIKALFLITGICAAFAAVVGGIYNAFGPTVLAISLIYFGVFAGVTVLLFGRTMLFQLQGYWSLWRELRPLADDPLFENETLSDARSETGDASADRQHPLD